MMHQGVHGLALVCRSTRTYPSSHIRLCRGRSLEILDRLLATFSTQIYLGLIGPPRLGSWGTRNVPTFNYCTSTDVIWQLGFSHP
jgi:hypothetical protein